MGKSIITPARVQTDRLMRFNPLASITPAILAAQLDQAEAGYLWQVARTWDAIARRDDKLPALIQKRLGALARYGWEILTPEGEEDDEAQAQKDALQYTFNHLRCVNAVDENERGGMSLALRKIGAAIFHRYSAQEIIWKPVKHAGSWEVSCELRAAPLWFFENTTGRLRFLETPSGTAGTPLEEGAWLIATGAGLMEALSVLWMYKRLPLQDWLTFSERFGMPGVLGRTAGAADSAQGQAMAAAVAAFGSEFEGVVYGDTDGSAKLELIRAEGGAGALPFPELIERCDRAMSIIVRGADLSTMSAGQGAGDGASLQGDESDLLEQDDAAWAAELLQEVIAREVIRWKFGPDAECKAYIRIKTKQTPDSSFDLQAVEKGVSLGMNISRTWYSERFGIPEAEEGEQVLGKKEEPTDPNAPAPSNSQPSTKNSQPGKAEAEAEALAENDRAADAVRARAGMRRYLANAKEHAARGLAADLEPLREEIRKLIAIPDAEFAGALAGFRAQGPALLRQIAAGGELEKAIAESLAPALLDGAASTRTQQSKQ